MRRYWVQVVGIVFLLVSSIAHSTGTDITKFSAGVRVVVDAEKDISELVKKYINRELNSLNDVTTVNVDPDYEIHVVAVRVSTWATEIGVAISAVMFECFDNETLEPFFEPRQKDVGMQLTTSLCRLPVYLLQVGPTNELEKLCQEIVADFEAKRLEPARRAFLKNRGRLEH
jgi:hypothetical protein